MTVVTRFAPSPTGFLHIGGARTALFNWLYAKHHGGQFLLRIEDTDRARSTEDAIQAIIQSMKWLQLDWDGEIVYQFSRASRHAEVAHQILAAGKAYYCYCTPEELEEMREKARAEGRSPRYDGRWRDRNPSEAPQGVKPVIRLKAPLEGESVVHDLVQGEVRVAHDQLDDMVLLRGDGTPTYMLAVVVDDHDMGITHVIRGDDHLTNTFRQKQIYEAMGWDVPSFSHIPLIHGQDGAKLSKRHGALGVEAYQEMGFLPEALLNYLLRLGWGHGDEEIISREQAIEWFDVVNVGRSASRFDLAKLTNLNAHYLREADDARLVELLKPFIARHSLSLDPKTTARLERGMPGLKQRARTLEDLAESALIYLTHLSPDDKAAALLTEEMHATLSEFMSELQSLSDWTHDGIEQSARSFAEGKSLGLGKLAQPLRAALTGRTVSPGIFEVMEILGKDESLARLKSVLQK